MKTPRHPLYATWCTMHARCRNPKNEDFLRYGGRGIRVCERWASFAAFAADMGPRPRGGTLDRIDSDGDYGPGNCRWASPLVQSNNRPGWNIPVTLNGETHNVSEWTRRLGVKPFFVYNRLRRGWTPERALTTPPANRGQSGAIAALQEATR